MTHWIDRFWVRVDKTQECWIWTGYLDRDGYGLFVQESGKTKRSHRVAYELTNGPLLKGKSLDHLCHDPGICFKGKKCPHRSCVNPSHLKPCSSKENSKRSNKATQTHCINGHEFNLENTYIKPNGTRSCRECHRIRELGRKPQRAEASRRYRERKKLRIQQ